MEPRRTNGTVPGSHQPVAVPFGASTRPSGAALGNQPWRPRLATIDAGRVVAA